MIQLGNIEQALLASLAAALVAAIGVLIAASRRHWGEKYSEAFAAIASGLLITTAILQLIPESVGDGPIGPAMVLVGYLAMFAINWMFSPAGEAQNAGRLGALLPVVGIGFHSLVDGFEYAILLHDADSLRQTSAVLGLIAHELVEGSIVYVLARRAGFSTLHAVILALLFSAATTPIGAAAAIEALPYLDEQAQAMLRAAAAGVLLYVGTTHLPRHIRRENQTRLLAPFALGVMVSIGLAMLHGGIGSHSHGGAVDHEHETSAHDHHDNNHEPDDEHDEEDHGDAVDHDEDNHAGDDQAGGDQAAETLDPTQTGDDDNDNL